jgi:hypothetical protein
MPIFGNIIKRGVTLGHRLDSRVERIKPIQHQIRVLQLLLRKAQFTAFGQYYHFRDILQEPNLIKAFQDSVPTFDYNTIHDRWWHMTLNKMEDVTWPGRVKYFALSSGTSGAPSKYIPVTNDMFRAMRRAGLRMFFALSRFNIDPNLYTKDMMMLGGSSDLQDGGGFFAGDLSGINASRPPFWLRSYYKPGNEIARIASWDERIEEIIKNAPNWDIGFMVGIPSWLQLMMERIIEHYNLKTIHDIWPNLGVCVHGGIHFEPYRKSFDKLMAHPLVYMDSYLASEGFIALQNRPDTIGMRLEINNGIFFEFVPFNEQNFDDDGNLRPNPEILNIDEVKEGIDYALLISTCAGAWRYLIGDTVRFIDKRRSEIIIAGRTKHYLSICGEHLSVDNMNHAVQHAEDVLDISIPEFTVSAVQSGSFYTHKWYVGCDPLVDKDKIKPLLDEKLKAINDDYRVERGSVLRDIEVEVIPASLFYKWQEIQGKMGGQHKFPRVMKNERFRDWEEFVRRSQTGQEVRKDGASI